MTIGETKRDSRFSAQVFEDDVADGCGDDGDGEVLDGEDVGEGDGEGLAEAVDAVELAHQQVGIEEEDDERNLDHRTADVGEQARVFGVLSHGDVGGKRACPVAGRAAAFLCRDWLGYSIDFIPWRGEIWVELAAEGGGHR